MEVSGWLQATAALHCEKEPPLLTHWIGGWLGSSAGLDVLEEYNLYLLLGFESRIEQPVA
jgi:hypothetical protein